MSHAAVARYMRAMGSHEIAELNEVPECPRPFVEVKPPPLPVKAYGARIVRCVWKEGER